MFPNPTPEEIPRIIYRRALESSLVHAPSNTQTAINKALDVMMCPIQVPTKVRVTHFCLEPTIAGGVGTLFRCGIYGRNWTVPTPEGANLLWDSGDQDANVTGDVSIPVDPLLVLWPSVYWVAVVSNSNASRFRSWDFHEVFRDQRDGCEYTLAAWGSLSNPCPAVVVDYAVSVKVGLLVETIKSVEEFLTPSIFKNTPPQRVSIKRHLSAVESSLVHATATITAAVANRVFLVPLQVMRQIRVEEVGISLFVAGGAGTNLRVGIYDKEVVTADSSTGARLLWDSGNQDANFPGPRSYAVNPPLILRPGLYWGAITFDNAVAQFFRWGFQYVFNSELNGCRYDMVGWGAFTDPCPAVVQDFLGATKMLFWGSN